MVFLRCLLALSLPWLPLGTLHIALTTGAVCFLMVPLPAVQVCCPGVATPVRGKPCCSQSLEWEHCVQHLLYAFPRCRAKFFLPVGVSVPILTPCKHIQHTCLHLSHLFQILSAKWQWLGSFAHWPMLERGDFVDKFQDTECWGDQGHAFFLLNRAEVCSCYSVSACFSPFQS